ncbi:MAG TPA: methyltransferase domain-containing protein, partial [Geobacterales bacterium]|nr:methyltransferase domain-containing protein [Geobacterales bacterium]
NNLGALAYGDGNLAEAENFFYGAIEQKANNWAARTNLADLYTFVPDLTRHKGSDRAFCPCCGGSFRSFISGGPNLRPNACCPRCGSLERHRLLWLYLQQKTNLFREKLRVLHFAPEKIFQDALRRLPNLDYVSADLYSPLAMVKMDITNITFADDSFDVILCNHVLEHIPDDRRAMAELLRVMKPDGWAILQVPIDMNRATTYEDPTIVTPEERQRHFGQDDHVRWYGRDYGDRLRESGFTLRIDQFAHEVPESHGILRDDDIYYCTKGVTANSEEKVTDPLLTKKIEAITSFIDFANGQRVPEHPINIYVESSSLCDMECVMCDHFSALDPKRLVNMKESAGFIEFDIINRLNDILPHALNVNCFGFGEATIHKQFKEIIDYIASFHVMIHFFTHGMHLDDEMCQFIVDRKVNRITVSFSGAKKEVYENIYIGCEFDRVISNMQRLAAIKRKSGTKYPHVAVNSLSFRDHIDDLVAFVDLMAHCGVDEIIVSQLYGAANLPQIHSQIAVLRPEVEGVVLEKARQRAKERGITFTPGSFERSLVHGDSDVREELSGKVFGISREEYERNVTQYDFTLEQMKEEISKVPYEKPSQSKSNLKTSACLAVHGNEKQLAEGLGITPPCLEPFKTFYVSSDGSVKPCCYWGSHEYTLGSTAEASGLDVWHGEGFTVLRKGILAGKYFTPGCMACASRKTWPKSHNLQGLVATYQSWLEDCYGQKLPAQLLKRVGAVKGNEDIVHNLHDAMSAPTGALAKGAAVQDTLTTNSKTTHIQGKVIPIPPDRLRFMNETPEQYLSIGDLLVKDLTNLAGLKKNSRILDIGSGYGRLAHSMMRSSGFQGQYIGLEILKLHSQWCRDQLGTLDPHFRFVHLDLRNDRYNPGGKLKASEVVFPQGDASQDVICLTSVFTHMYEEEIRHYLTEIHRLLAPGGRCYATFFLLNAESLDLMEAGKSTIAMKLVLNDHCRYLNPDDPLHAIGYDELWLQQLVESCGLKTETVAHGAWCGRKTDNIYQDVLVLKR